MAGAGRGTDQKTSILRSFATAASLSLFSRFVPPLASRPLIVVELHNSCIIFAFNLKHRV